MATEVDYPYEASDEASENEFLDQSLSLWKGWSALKEADEDFAPVPLDLHTASSIGQYDAVRTYIHRKDEDLNRKNKGGWTPLMYASYIGHDNVVNLLLDAGVSVHVRNNKGQTPLMLAASCGNESVGYFLLQQGAELEAKDRKGWTILFHATYAGHQNMVKFLLDNDANMEVVEPVNGYTPLMWAASEGHEIIVQYFLQFGAKVRPKAKDGNTARCLALINGFTKIVSLIDNHMLSGVPLRSEPGLNDDLSSSDESFQRPHYNSRGYRSKPKGPSILEGPAAFDKLLKSPDEPVKQPNVPGGYVSFKEDSGFPIAEQFSYRDFTSPINPEDHMDNYRDSAEADDEDSAFAQHGVLTIKSSSNSSDGLAAAFQLSRDSSAESIDDRFDKIVISKNGRKGSRKSEDQTEIANKVETKSKHSEHHKIRRRKSVTIDEQWNKNVPANYSKTQVEPQNGTLSSELPGKNRKHLSEQARKEQLHIAANRPQNLITLIEHLGLTKYMPVFEEQDVDLQVFLTMTDNDLKEVGIKLLGPRKKMNNAIARWHSNARPAGNNLEQAYADKLESEMQEMAVRLTQAYEEVETLKAQVLQERELRSVAESCLMEHRLAWEQVFFVTNDTQLHCKEMQRLLQEINSFNEEIKSLQNDSYTDNSNNLSAAMKEQTASGESVKSNKHLQVLQKLEKCYENIKKEVAVAYLNTDKLLGRNNEMQGTEASGYS